MKDKVDIYFLEQYGKIYQKNGEGNLEVFNMKSQYGDVSYMFLKRQIDIKLDEIYFDIITPYGYGGPLFSNYSDENLGLLINEFKIEFEKYCDKGNIISEFVRFHPLLCNHICMDLYMNISNIRNTVCIDLESEKTIWDNISSKCRNMIRKAEKNEIKIEIGDSDEDLRIFAELYIDTMKKNGALEYYMFDSDFFKNTMELLKGNIKIFKAIYNDEVISAAMIMHCGDYIHYHFSGSNIEYSKLAANNLLLYKTAIWGYEQGFKYFHLGGGYSGNDDSLFKFKKSFYRGEPKSFYVGKKIHNDNIYNELVNIVKQEKIINENYFPLYRG